MEQWREREKKLSQVPPGSLYLNKGADSIQEHKKLSKTPTDRWIWISRKSLPFLIIDRTWKKRASQITRNLEEKPPIQRKQQINHWGKKVVECFSSMSQGNGQGEGKAKSSNAGEQWRPLSCILEAIAINRLKLRTDNNFAKNTTSALWRIFETEWRPKKSEPLV